MRSCERRRSRAASWRSSKSSADSRCFACGVRVREAVEQRLQQVAVAGRHLVERGLLEPAARVLVRSRRARRARGARRGRAAARPTARAPRISSSPAAVARGGARSRPASSTRQRAASVSAATRSASGGRSPSSRTSGASGRAERLVDARQHPAQAAGAVGREQAQPIRVVVGAERAERGVERLAAEHGGLRLVELAEARVEACLERVRLEQPVAEAVDRRDPGAVELAGEVVAAPRAQLGADARCRSSPAARFVYVMTRIESTSTPSSQTARTKRSTSTAVLPVPAPAETKTSPRASIAAACSGFGAWRTRCARGRCGTLTPAPPGTSTTAGTRPGTRRRAGRAGRRRRGCGRRAHRADRWAPSTCAQNASSSR